LHASGFAFPIKEGVLLTAGSLNGTIAKQIYHLSRLQNSLCVIPAERRTVHDALAEYGRTQRQERKNMYDVNILFSL